MIDQRRPSLFALAQVAAASAERSATAPGLQGQAKVIADRKTL